MEYKVEVVIKETKKTVNVRADKLEVCWIEDDNPSNHFIYYQFYRGNNVVAIFPVSNVESVTSD